MANMSRRLFVSQGALGLAGASGLLLAPDILPTESSGSLGAYGAVLQQEQPNLNGPVPVLGNAQPAAWTPTEPNILGPYHRPGAPFRAKITPPMEPGEVLVISGRVWAQDTRRPLSSALIDIWQANAQGRYDNDDAQNPPAATFFKNRARLITDENGYYEYETVQPGRYQIGQNTWRPAHIHYYVRHAGYRDLVTQLYFRNDPHNRTDNWIRQSLIIDLREQQGPNNSRYKTGSFDVVLARQQGS
jgi:catechol 1,2-dioxygenase